MVRFLSCILATVDMFHPDEFDHHLCLTITAVHDHQPLLDQLPVVVLIRYILVAVGADRWMRFWNVHDGTCLLQLFTGHKAGESVMAVAVDADNRTIVTGDAAGFIKVSDSWPPDVAFNGGHGLAQCAYRLVQWLCTNSFVIAETRHAHVAFLNVYCDTASPYNADPACCCCTYVVLCQDSRMLQCCRTST